MRLHYKYNKTRLRVYQRIICVPQKFLKEIEEIWKGLNVRVSLRGESLKKWEVEISNVHVNTLTTKIVGNGAIYSAVPCEIPKINHHVQNSEEYSSVRPSKPAGIVPKSELLLKFLSYVNFVRKFKGQNNFSNRTGISVDLWNWTDREWCHWVGWMTSKER